MSADIERYESMFQFSPVGCLLVEDGVIRHASPEAIATMGIPGDRMVGVPLAELLVPEFEEACLDLLSRVGESPEPEPVRLAAGLCPSS